MRYINASEDYPSRRTLAEDAGFDPQPGDGEQPAMTDAEYEALPVDHPMKARLARWAHQGSIEGCTQCGERCDRCDDRMCSQWGPEPRACGTTCADCPCSCTACLDARADRAADTLRHIEREKSAS